MDNFTEPSMLLTRSVISASPLCFDGSADESASASAVPLSLMHSTMIPLSCVRVALGFSKDEAIRFTQDYSERLKIQINLR